MTDRRRSVGYDDAAALVVVTPVPDSRRARPITVAAKK